MARVSFGARLTQLAEANPEAVALVCGDDALSREALEARANRLARLYAESGARHGRLVTLGLDNGIELVAGCFAAWKLGAVPSPISSRLPSAERAAIIEQADPALVVGVSADEAGGRPTLAADVEASAASHSPDPLPDQTAPHERALASGGSTGRPKLILPASPASYDPETASRLFLARRAVVVPGPLRHAVPFSATFQGILGGAAAVVMPRFDAAVCLDLIETHRADRVHFVPTMMLRIWRLPESERLARDLSSLDFVMTGGAPCPAWLMRAWIEWLGPDVLCEAFGPSERIGGTFISGREWLAHPGSVGRPTGGELRIQDPESGRALPPGEMGEIYMRPASGPGSTYRYLGATGNVDAQGWESVGDMGALDSEGYLYLGDRRSDMILCGGRNVYPAEVEAALESHPAVRSCAVIGLPDEDLGSRVHALVELAEALEPEALRGHVAQQLAAYKVPGSFEWVDAPLRDDAGKVRRDALRVERM